MRGAPPLQSDPYELTIIGGNPAMEAITKNQFVLREFVRKTSTDLLKKLEEMEDRQTEILEKLSSLLAGIEEPVEK